jgi:hypothetical protein
MFISHFNCPNFRVLSDFRKDNYEFFKECFKQSALLAMEAGLASLGHVSLDGSKFKANTSKHKAMSYKRLKAKEKELTEEIEDLIAEAAKCDEEEDEEYQDKTGYEIPEELKIKEKRLARIKEAKKALENREKELNPGKEIDDKKQISFADKEARIMGKKGNFDYSVGQHLTQNANDKKEVKPALKEMKETTGDLPDKMSLDNGYMSGDNLESFDGKGIDVYIATGKGEKRDQRPIEDSDRKISKSDFIYDEDIDCFVCPAGNTLELKSVNSDGKKVYQALKAECDACPYRARCCTSKRGELRTIITDNKEPLRQKMNKKMEQESSKEIYKKRKKIVEPVFGQIKNSGFRGFSLRGYEKGSGEFSLACTVHNFKKIVKAILGGKVCLDSGGLAPVVA